MNQWLEVQLVGPIREVAKVLGNERSPEWRKVRAKHLKENPECAFCGKKQLHMQVHHVWPFHIQPELELEPSNLITLCREHHFLVGHLLNWSSYNINVLEDSAEWLHKIKNRPKKN